jgi:hypothetical protein
MVSAIDKYAARYRVKRKKFGPSGTAEGSVILSAAGSLTVSIIALTVAGSVAIVVVPVVSLTRSVVSVSGVRSGSGGPAGITEVGVGLCGKVGIGSV